jgi:uncharacterized damage-inducible protein DinB
MKEQIEAWQINNRINLYLLNSIDEAYLTDVSASKGRNVGEQFAHLHNVRLMWLKASAPELADNQQKIETSSSITKKLLSALLTNSSIATEKLLEKGFQKVRSKILNRILLHF